MTFAGFTIAMFVMGMAGSAYSAYQQAKMADEAKDIAKQNIKIEEKRVERQMEMAEKANERKISGARARMAASGLQEEGTPGFYMAELESLGDDEIMWMEREGEWRKQQLKLEGKQAASQLNAGAVASLVGIFTGGAQFLQNYDTKASAAKVSQPVPVSNYLETSGFAFDYGYGYSPYKY